MRAANVGHVPVMFGGLIHADDVPELHAIGVKGIFGPGTTVDEVMEFLTTQVRAGSQ